MRFMIIVYGENKKVLHQDFCIATRKYAERKAERDRKWLDGVSWEVIEV